MAETASAPSLNLKVGDRVVYPNQGLCNVTDIKNEEIAGQKLVFVSLVFIETGARVKVPQEKLAKNGVRRVASPDDAKKVFEFLKSDSEKASLDWKKRARDNTERLAGGGLIGLAEVVKGLQVLSELRPLPPKEREQYNDARHLFVTELAAALNVPQCDAEDMLDIVLFPVGKERPKRTAEEFKALLGDDLDGLGDDLLGIDGGSEEESSEESEESAEESEDGEGEDDAPKKAAKGKKAAPEKAEKPAKEKPVKEKKEKPAAEPKPAKAAKVEEAPPAKKAKAPAKEKAAAKAEKPAKKAPAKAAKGKK